MPATVEPCPGTAVYQISPPAAGSAPGAADPAREPGLRRVVALVEANPGANLSTIVEQLHGRRTTRSGLVAFALAAGLIHARPPSAERRTTGRSAPGLFPGPGQTQTAASMTGEQLRAERTGAGLSVRGLASRLDVHASLISHWEAGRKTIPRWAIERLPPILDDARRSRGRRPPGLLPNPASIVREQILTTVANEPGIHLTALRARVGYSRQVLIELDAALAAGELHRARHYWQNNRRPGVGIMPGAAPRRSTAPAVTPAGLRAARTAAGWTLASAAARLRDSGSTVQRWPASTLHRWESGRTPIPPTARPALEQLMARAGAAAKVDRTARQRGQLLATLRTQPGLSRKRLLRACGGGRDVLVALEQLLGQGAIHHDGGRGLRVGPAPDPLSGTTLRWRRQAAGLSQRELASLVGVTQGMLCRFEQLPAVPEKWAARLTEQLDSAGDATARLEQSLLEALESGPQTYEALTRGRFGRGDAVHTAIARLLTAGLAHEGTKRQKNAAGQLRDIRVILAGPAEDAAPVELPADLAAARHAAGLSLRQVAEQMGVSRVMVGRWERGPEQVPPGRRADYAAALANLAGTMPSTLPRAASTDAELEEAALAIAATSPGLTRTDIARRLPGTTQRRLDAISRLVKRGQLIEGPPSPDKRGRKAPSLGLPQARL